MLITINLLLIWGVSLMHTHWLWGVDRKLEQSKDRQGYLEDRLRELEDRIKYIEQTNCMIFNIEDKSELPETDIETVKEAIK